MFSKLKRRRILREIGSVNEIKLETRSYCTRKDGSSIHYIGSGDEPNLGYYMHLKKGPGKIGYIRQKYMENDRSIEWALREIAYKHNLGFSHMEIIGDRIRVNHDGMDIVAGRFSAKNEIYLFSYRGKFPKRIKNKSSSSVKSEGIGHYTKVVPLKRESYVSGSDRIR